MFDPIWIVSIMHNTSIVHCRLGNGQIFAPQDKVPCWNEFVLRMQCLFFEVWSFGFSFTTALCVKSGLSEPHRSQKILVRSWTMGTACWSPICIINYLLEKPQIGLIPTLIDLVRAMRSPSSIDTGDRYLRRPWKPVLGLAYNGMWATLKRRVSWTFKSLRL